jgi:hypothetical protein
MTKKCGFLDQNSDNSKQRRACRQAGLHFFKFCARPIFSKSLPRHQLCRILLFQKSKPKAVLLSKLSVFTFFFKVGVWGKRKFSVLEFREFGTAESGATE